MKIAFVTDTYAPQPNGVATTLQMLVRQLRHKGWQADLIRPAVIDCDEEGMQVPSVALPVYTDIRVGFPKRKALENRWSIERPDIIYVASSWTLGASAIKAARKLNIPVASGFHTNFQKYMAHYQVPFLESITTKYLRHVHNSANCTFVSSDDAIDGLAQEGFHNLELMPKGVDAQLFSPDKRDPLLRKEWGLSSDKKVAGLYVGRIAAEKNLPLVVQAFSEIRHRIPEFQGIFIGDGPKLSKLKRQHPEFIYPGARFGEDLAQHYASADLFVFPSVTETFGNVTLEAMASGLGVIAFDYAGAGSHINNKINGYTARLADEDAFINLALFAATDPHLPKVRAAARNSAEKSPCDKVASWFEERLMRLIDQQKEPVLQ